MFKKRVLSIFLSFFFIGFTSFFSCNKEEEKDPKAEITIISITPSENSFLDDKTEINVKFNYSIANYDSSQKYYLEILLKSSLPQSETNMDGLGYSEEGLEESGSRDINFVFSEGVLYLRENIIVPYQMYVRIHDRGVRNGVRHIGEAGPFIYNKKPK